jgi:hypothetical protein
MESECLGKVAQDWTGESENVDFFAHRTLMRIGRGQHRRVADMD